MPYILIFLFFCLLVTLDYLIKRHKDIPLDWMECQDATSIINNDVKSYVGRDRLKKLPPWDKLKLHFKL